MTIGCGYHKWDKTWIQLVVNVPSFWRYANKVVLHWLHHWHSFYTLGYVEDFPTRSEHIHNAHGLPMLWDSFWILFRMIGFKKKTKRESRPGKLYQWWFLGMNFSKYPLPVSLFLCPPCSLKHSVVRGIVQCDAFTLRPLPVFPPWISSFGGAILVLLVLAWVFVVPQRKICNMCLSIDFTGPRAPAWYPDLLVCVGALKPWGLAKTNSRGAHKSHTNRLTTLPCWWSTYDAASSRRKQFLKTMTHFDASKACFSFITLRCI